MSDAPETAAAEAEAPSGPKSKLPMIAAIVVGLAVGGGSGAAVVGPIVAKKMGIGAAVHADSTAEGADGAAEEAGHGGEGEKGAKGEAVAPPVLLLENLVLNPAASGGSRYLLMSIAIESVDKAAVDALTLRDAELKDLILATLGRKNVDELSDVAGREAIKVELIAAVKERFGKNSIKQLYFPQFVIQ